MADSRWQALLAQLRSACSNQNWSEAESILSQAKRLDARHPWLFFGLGYYYRSRGQIDAARAAFKQAGGLYEAKLNLALLERDQGQYLLANEILAELLQRQPWQLPLWQERVSLLQLTGQRAALTELSTQLLTPVMTELFEQHGFGQSWRSWRPSLDALLLINAFSEDQLDYSALANGLAHWRQRHLGAFLPPSQIYSQTPEPERPLRLGFVSNEWGAAPVELGYGMLFKGLDPEKYSLYAYCDQGQPLESDVFAMIRFTQELDAYAFYAQVQRDQIDILIDLSGLFNPLRLPSLALQPVPIQVLAASNPPFLPVPGVYQAILTDAELLPSLALAQPDENYLLQSSFFHWRPPVHSPEPGEPQAEQPARLAVLGSPNKITARSLQLWAKVLNAIPQAQLTFKNQAYTDALLREQLKQRWREAGGNLKQVLFADNTQQPDYFSFLQTQDCVLDTWPYAGALSTCDAAWMGVPVLGLSGGRQINQSLAKSLKSPDFIALDAEDYVAKALNLTQAEVTANWRQELRGRILQSPLCDGERQVAEFSAFCRTLWQNWCQQQSGA